VSPRPRSWLRGSGRIGPGRWTCCGIRRGGCDGGHAGAQHSRRGRPRQPTVLVDEAAVAVAARVLHEQAAAATGAAAPAVFGPPGGMRSRLSSGPGLTGVGTPIFPQSAALGGGPVSPGPGSGTRLRAGLGLPGAAAGAGWSRAGCGPPKVPRRLGPAPSAALPRCPAAPRRSRVPLFPESISGAESRGPPWTSGVVQALGKWSDSDRQH
jgi:hypothetical protein